MSKILDYPANLPAPTLEGNTIEHAPDFTRVEVFEGLPRFIERPRGFTGVSLRWIYNARQYNSYRSWRQNELANNFFNIAIPLGDVPGYLESEGFEQNQMSVTPTTVSAHFSEETIEQRLPSGLFEVVGRIEFVRPNITDRGATVRISDGGSSSNLPTDISDGGSSSNLPTDISDGRSSGFWQAAQ